MTFNDTIMLDARPPAFYQGQRPWIKPGHIPGAVNLPWRPSCRTLSRNYSPEPEIRKLIGDLGITPEKTISPRVGQEGKQRMNLSCSDTSLVSHSKIYERNLAMDCLSGRPCSHQNAQAKRKVFYRESGGVFHIQDMPCKSGF